MTVPHDMYIDGCWVESSGRARIEVVDPATEEVVDSVPHATAEDLDAALDAARRGWTVWRETDAWARSAVLRKTAGLLRERAETLAQVLTEEQGKPLPEARAEAAAAADQFDWYADETRRIYGRVVEGRSSTQRLIVIRQPIGPVAAFSPWNFPALLSARKIAPALAAGCSIVIKPAEEAPRTAMLVVQACAEAGLPPGAVNLVTGDPEQISTHLIGSDIIRKVSITGSVPVGRKIMHLCVGGIKPVTMELGGHSPVLVFADTDIEASAETCARAKFRNNGQVCIAASRYFVHESVVEAFTRRFVEITKSLRVGNGREEGVDIGPLSNRRRLDAAESLVADAVDKGAVVAAGGRRPPELSRGFFYEPTVLCEVDDSMKVMHDEPFCPLAPITSFRNMEDAVAKANATPYGLAAYVFTRETRTAFLASEALEAGMIGVNNLVLAAPELPFGGIKMSGFGREGGSEGVESYSVTKVLNMLL